MRKWLIYTRVSTKGQEERYGLDAQKNNLTDYAKKMGWDYELLNEGAVSGETIYERPKMTELLKKIKTGEYEGCLIIEEERLSRSKRLGDWDDIKEAFRQGKAKIATPSKMLDPESVDDDFLIDLSGVLSKREKRIILQRMTRGKAEKLKQGKSIGATSIPFGYKANPETSEIEIYPEEKKVYDMIIDWVLDGKGLYVVTNKLNEMAIPTRYGRKGWKMKKQQPTNLWRASTLYRILKQEFYTGLKPMTFHFTKYHKEDVDIYYPSLISAERFWQLQTKLAGQNIRKKENSYFFQLKDLLRCGLCGRKVYGHGSPKKRKNGGTYIYKFYRCENRNPPPKGINCKMKSVEQHKVEDAVWNEVLALVNNSDKLALLIKEKQESMNGTIKESSSKLESLKEFLAKKEDEEKRLITAYRQGVVSLEELDAEKTKMVGEKTGLVKEINKLEHEKRSLLFEKEKNKSVNEYFQEVKKKVSNFSPEEVYEFYRFCIDSVTLNYDQEKSRHSIDINFAIPIIYEKTTKGRRAFEHFSSGDIQGL